MKFHLSLLFFVLLFSGCSNPFQNEQGSTAPIWVQVASAEQQCITPEYSSLEEAIQELKDDNITVIDSRELNLVVCEACSCPTGIIYQAEIKKNDLEKAAQLGWEALGEGDDTPE
tara:strand:- start:48082 stop:48426 length:345 start_codon:yes stop_codon:yes gene_type:complete